MAAALGNRSFGFFRRARATSASIAGDTERFTEDGATGSSCTCA